MSTYEDKYKKYKKMYLELKYGQKAGGESGAPKLSDVQDWINQKFKFKMSDQDYGTVISKLEKLKQECDNLIYETNVNEIQNKIRNLYNNLTTKEFSELNLKNIFKDENMYMLEQINWRQYPKVLCQYANEKIRQLEGQKSLQQKIVERFKNTNVDPNIDFNKYIEYAKENNLFDKQSVDEIIDSYAKKSQNLANYWTKQKEESGSLLSNIKAAIPGFYPTSKNGHKCVTSCTKSHDLLHGDYYKCDTDPYKFMLKDYTWDYCNDTASK